jgi:hypothetical protein
MLKSFFTSKSTDGGLSPAFRLLGLAPLAFFIARLWHFIDKGEVGYILWICHIANCALSLGMLTGQRELVRASVPWLILGVPLWMWDMINFGIGTPTTFATHIGGLATGLYAISRIKGGQKSWLYAIAGFIILQQISRMITPYYMNVNMAHYVYRGWDMLFPSYSVFWVSTAALSCLCIWALGKLFVKLFPAKAADADRRP